MAANLSLENESIPSVVRRTLTYHEDHAAGDQLKLECGEDELDEEVPAGKTWDVQVTILVTETDA